MNSTESLQVPSSRQAVAPVKQSSMVVQLSWAGMVPAVRGEKGMYCMLVQFADYIITLF